MTLVISAHETNGMNAFCSDTKDRYTDEAMGIV